MVVPIFVLSFTVAATLSVLVLDDSMALSKVAGVLLAAAIVLLARYPSSYAA